MPFKPACRCGRDGFLDGTRSIRAFVDCPRPDRPRIRKPSQPVRGNAGRGRLRRLGRAWLSSPAGGRPVSALKNKWPLGLGAVSMPPRSPPPARAKGWITVSQLDVSDSAGPVVPPRPPRPRCFHASTCRRPHDGPRSGLAGLTRRLEALEQGSLLRGSAGGPEGGV